MTKRELLEKLEDCDFDTPIAILTGDYDGSYKMEVEEIEIKYGRILKQYENGAEWNLVSDIASPGLTKVVLLSSG